MTIDPDALHEKLQSILTADMLHDDYAVKRLCLDTVVLLEEDPDLDQDDFPRILQSVMEFLREEVPYEHWRHPAFCWLLEGKRALARKAASSAPAGSQGFVRELVYSQLGDERFGQRLDLDIQFWSFNGDDELAKQVLGEKKRNGAIVHWLVEPSRVASAISIEPMPKREEP